MRKDYGNTLSRVFAMAVSLLIPIIAFNSLLYAQVQVKKNGYQKVEEYIAANMPAQFVAVPEGQFVAAFNDDVAKWLRKKFNKALITRIRNTLEPRLRIELSARGFAPAAMRASGGAKDETNYDAIWVRDNVWVYYDLLSDSARRGDARKLLLALWDYYSTDAQIARFQNIINHPELATDQMAMPHIRFNGSSPGLDDVMIDGKPQDWNHRQIDAHGIYFSALAEAVKSGLIGSAELTDKRFKVLSLYPLFLEKIKFENYEDAGAWEELPRKNTSSIGLAVKSLQGWKELLYVKNNSALSDFRNNFFEKLNKEKAGVKGAWSEAALKKLAQRGLGVVKEQLLLGGESPDYAPDDIHFRLADAALLFLIVPTPVQGLSEAEQRKVLLIVETLERPLGILRYQNDSYQCGNYWVKPPSRAGQDKPALTGDTSSAVAYAWRLSQLIPDTEAQWFFDSLLALARLRLAEETKDAKLKKLDIHLATLHLKRALGQITTKGITADGKAVGPWQAPESINTVVIAGKKSFLASPIVPLNWARAGLSMALREYEKATSD